MLSVQPSLHAENFTPAKLPLSAVFAEGESTSTLLSALPRCTLSHSAGSVLELYNVNNRFVAGRHGPISNTTSTTTVLWNTTAHPMLNTRHAGRYICRTDMGYVSTDTYELNVLGKFTWYINWYCICLLIVGSSCKSFGKFSCCHNFGSD